ncbi:DUF2085 domain-containing protein [Methanolobus profundi]|uniref:Predicted membrane protein n=1 Tax=Methanolobus profundi TaxID=487685 RepID=A0A1I4R3R7_9EURY|nr:DUF2085 domain-containing protein [Methanolobus profundi]SFM46942.1 Predicted membrane protein [Methanolobus profundi]
MKSLIESTIRIKTAQEHKISATMTDIASLKNEIVSGWNETSKYLISHHECHEYYKCLELNYRGKKQYICSRCLGVYIGILSGILYYSYISATHLSYTMIALLPMAALIDWSVTAFRISKSNNIFRVTSGFLLGIAYLNGALLFLQNRTDYMILAIGVFYASASLLLLYLKKRRMQI